MGAGQQGSADPGLGRGTLRGPGQVLDHRPPEGVWPGPCPVTAPFPAHRDRAVGRARGRSTAPRGRAGLSSNAWLGLLGLALRLGRRAGGRSGVREWAVDQSLAARCPLPVRSGSRHQVTGAPRDARPAPYKPWGSEWQAGGDSRPPGLCVS